MALPQVQTLAVQLRLPLVLARRVVHVPWRLRRRQRGGLRRRLVLPRQYQIVRLLTDVQRAAGALVRQVVERELILVLADHAGVGVADGAHVAAVPHAHARRADAGEAARV